MNIKAIPRGGYGLGTDTRTIGLAFDNGDRRTLDLNLGQLYHRCARPRPVVEDLLLIASVVYAVDRSVKRRTGFDFWCRNLNITIPVQEIELFQSFAKEISELLRFLTGDIWNINFKKLRLPLYNVQRRRIKWDPLTIIDAQCVSLFSGGLDSAVGAINWLETNPSKGLLLAGHYDASVGGPKSQQKRVYDVLRKRYGSRVNIVQTRSGVNPSRGETTFRSRSFLFLALGIVAASSIDEGIPLLMPENGMIAVNIPLSEARVGSCSTRTANPIFLSGLAEVLRKLGIGVVISNPFDGLTKGEVVSRCNSLESLKEILLLTNSCARSSHRFTWDRMNASECGRCMPCIYRRAALHSIGLDKSVHYGNNALKARRFLSLSGWADIRAFVDLLVQVNSVAEVRNRLLRTADLSGDLLLEESETVFRGLNEVRSFLDQPGSSFRGLVSS